MYDDLEGEAIAKQNWQLEPVVHTRSMAEVKRDSGSGCVELVREKKLRGFPLTAGCAIVQDIPHSRTHFATLQLTGYTDRVNILCRLRRRRIRIRRLVQDPQRLTALDHLEHSLSKIRCRNSLLACIDRVVGSAYARWYPDSSPPKGSGLFRVRDPEAQRPQSAKAAQESIHHCL